MQYLRGFSAMRQDPEWGKKLLVGSVLFLSAMFVPIIGQLALLGWVALITRQAVARKGEPGPLPRLDFDFGWLGKLVGIGFKPFLVNFLWRLPAAVLIGGSVACMYVGMIVAAVGSSAARHGGGGGGSGAASGVIVVVFGIVMVLLVPISIALAAPAQIAMLRVEVTDDMNAGMQFKPVLKMTRLVLKELIIGSLIIALVSIPLAIAGMLLCYVGIFPVAVVLQIVTAHFSAQLYEVYLEKGGEPLTIGPDPETAAPPAPPAALPATPPPAAGW